MILADIGYLIVILGYHLITIFILIFGINSLFPAKKKITNKNLLKNLYPSILIGYGTDFIGGFILSSLNLSLGSYNLILFSLYWFGLYISNQLIYQFKQRKEVEWKKSDFRFTNRSYNKSFFLISITSGLLAIIELTINIFSIPIYFEFQYGLFWALFIEIFAVIISNLINKLLPKKRKIQSEILKVSIITSILTSYGIWALFLTLFGLFGFLFGFYIFISLRLYWILLLIYFVILVITLRFNLKKQRGKKHTK